MAPTLVHSFLGESEASVIFDHILCHYSEIGLKGRNRSFFEDRLKANILDTVKLRYPNSVKSVRRYYGRLVVRIADPSANLAPLIDVLKDVLGLAYFAPAFESTQEIDYLKTDAHRLLSEMDFQSFRITARRGGNEIPLKAQRVNEEVGAHIVETMAKKVNLSAPDANCYIDMFEKKAFIYPERIIGRGGLPVGVSGRVAVMLSGGIDSPVAAYLAMKRGAKAIFVHFHSIPYTTPASIEKVREMINTLNRFQMRSKLYLVELAPVQKQVVEKTAARFRVLLYRRFMLRITDVIARKERVKGVVTGESLGQVASQTLENMAAVGRVINMTILRPLVGFDKQEIIDRAKDIGTYDISILPDQDCCSLFVPKRPSTKARTEQLEKEEEVLNIDELVDAAVETASSELID
ncbi:MAG: tRNA uracil 4-sulfurtransferase ThiI [Candidatus Neomarinimicrobiota bacterium]|nr:tRNA uracil 4-sulfurtransferase ThiI [Candidatus Neomarinimicrobiota bacterium]